MLPGNDRAGSEGDKTVGQTHLEKMIYSTGTSVFVGNCSYYSSLSLSVLA